MCGLKSIERIEKNHYQQEIMFDMVHTQVIVLTQEQHITTGEDFIPTTNLEETQTHFPASLKQTKPVSSCCDPEKRLDWSNIVDSVLKEEIGKMAEEFKNGKF